MSAVDALSVTETVYVKERLEKIKSTGYWHVNIRPIEFEEYKIKPLERCWEIIQDCAVNFRGWTLGYPPINERERVWGDDWAQSGAEEPKVDLELWRFYQSGQFIHYFFCWEDEWISKEKPRVLSVKSTLYRMTEIYEFAARLARKDVFENHVKISISLVGMMDRELHEGNDFTSFMGKSDKPEINFESTLSILKLLGSAHNEAVDRTMEIISVFKASYPRMFLISDQERLVEKRLG